MWYGLRERRRKVRTSLASQTLATGPEHLMRIKHDHTTYQRHPLKYPGFREHSALHHRRNLWLYFLQLKRKAVFLPVGSTLNVHGYKSWFPR